MNSFYFDFTSPYSYLAWERLLQLKFPLESLVIRPVLVGKIINEVGGIGPAAISAKRNFLFQDCLRKSAKMQIKLTAPGTLPFNPMDMLRFAISLGTSNQALMHKYITSTFRYGWSLGNDFEDYENFKNYTLKELNISSEFFETHQSSRDARKVLKENISQAIADQVFGVPSFVVNRKVFWGLDTIEDFLLELESRDTFDAVNSEYKRFLNIIENKTMEES